jgi:hypothetical protein
MRPTRTVSAAVATAFAALLLGCDAATDAASDALGRRTIDQTVAIREDERHLFAFTVPAKAKGEKATIPEVRIALQRVGGPPIDVYLVDRAGLSAYDAGKVFRSFGVLSNALIEECQTGWVALPPGQYWILLDNTNRGALRPPANLEDDVVTVTCRIWQRP